MSGIALCYVRKSLVRSASDEISPERQRTNIAAEAERRGFVVRFFEDAEGHHSGRNENRPGWKSLKSQLDEPEVKAVIVESLSRASRSIRDLFNFIEEMNKRKILLISLKENFDTNSAMGVAFVGLIALMNQFESDVASERMKMTVVHIRNSRKQHWGFVPFGCARQKPDQKLAPSRDGIWRLDNSIVAGKLDTPPFAHSASNSAKWFGYLEAVQKCFELYTTTDVGFQELAGRLNDQGFLYRDRYGVPRTFCTDDVRRMIDLVEIYAGHLPQRNTKESKLIMNAHPAILPGELCEKVIAVREARHSRWGRGGGKPKQAYLLANLYCAECGAHLIGQFEHGIRYYRHSNQKKNACSQTKYVHAEIIETAVLNRLEFFNAPEEMKARIQDQVRRLGKQALKPEWGNARRSMATLNDKLERLKTLFVDHEVDMVEYHRRKATIEEQKKELAQTLQATPRDVKTLEDLLPKVDQMANVIREGNPVQQREALTALFDRVEFKGNKITNTLPREWAKPFFTEEPR